MKRLKILVICGHGAGDPGACSAYGTERDEARKVGKRIVELFRGYENVDVSLYPTSRNAYYDVKNNCVQVNFGDYDYILEVHFNSSTSSSANGVEIWVTPSENGISVEQGIVNNLGALGYTNRGIKRDWFAVITSAKNKGTSAALLETCFINNKPDMDRYKSKFEDVCKGIVSGVADGFGLVKKNELFRVRIAWNNIPSQLGAYSTLENAKKNCPEGYSVYNESGVCLYTKTISYKHEYCVCYCNDIDERAALYLSEYFNCECLDATISKDWKYYAKRLICVGGDSAPIGFSGYKTHWVKGDTRYTTAKNVINVCVGVENIDKYKI